MQINLVRYWKVELFEGNGHRSSVISEIISTEGRKPFFTGYSKKEPCLNCPDDKFIELFASPETIDTYHIRRSLIGSVRITPVYEEKRDLLVGVFSVNSRLCEDALHSFVELLDEKNSKPVSGRCITLNDGSRIDFWAMTCGTAWCGRAYDIVLIDGRDLSPEILEDVWEKSIYKTLLPRNGRAEMFLLNGIKYDSAFVGGNFIPVIDSNGIKDIFK